MTAATRTISETQYTPTSDAAPAAGDARPWHPAALIAFRFAVIYFGVYVLITQMLGSLLPIPVQMPEFGTWRPFSSLVIWVGAHVLHTSTPVTVHPSGSGDRLFDYVQAYTLLLVAAFGAVAWSVSARARTRHDRLYACFRLFLRFALGTTMLSYGFAKAPPLQMPITDLRRLVEPFGNFSPMGVLWTSIGAAPGYEIFAGCAEILGGVLVMIPVTATLGALVCLADVTNVWLLNMTYDVPVKLFSFTLVVMSLVLLAPQLRRLCNILILHREDRIAPEPAIGAGPRARRRFVVAQLAFAACVVALNAWGSARAWTQYGGGAPRSPLFGIWDVNTMTLDGTPSAPLLSDTTRWRRVIFQFPQALLYQQMNDRMAGMGAKLDTVAHTLTLSPRDAKKPKSVLTYARPERSRLLLDGTLNGHLVHMELALRDPDSYMVRSRGFHWVQENPFNR